MPKPPEDLSDLGQMGWNEVGGGLYSVGHLQTPYLPLLRLFARACDVAGRAWEELEASDSLIREGRGGGVNPHFRVWKDAAGTARALGEQLGASPWRCPGWAWLGFGG
jgi:phage terminase small subunit